MNIIETIKAEVVRLMQNEITHNSNGVVTGEFRVNARQLMDFLDTLESENTYDTRQYTPRPSVGIEDVARVQFASHAKVFDKKRKAVFDWEQFKEVVGIFYGFGRGSSEKPNNHEEHVPEIKETGTRGLDEAAKAYALDTAEDTEQYSARYLGYKDGAKWQKEQDDKELSEKIAAAYQLGIKDKEQKSVEGLDEAADAYEEGYFEDCESAKRAAYYGFKAGAKWRDRQLNWARDLVQAGIDKPENAANLMKRLKELL